MCAQHKVADSAETMTEQGGQSRDGDWKGLGTEQGWDGAGMGTEHK